MFSRIGNILLESDCILFGGFVRDMMLSKHYAKMFFEREFHHAEFENKNACPGTVARLTLPSDIDAFAHIGSVSNICLALDNQGFEVELQKGSSYKFLELKEQYSHFKLTCRLRNRDLFPEISPLPSVHVDLIVTADRFVKPGYTSDSKDPYHGCTSMLPPFNKCNFDVNAFLQVKPDTGNDDHIFLSPNAGLETDRASVDALKAQLYRKQAKIICPRITTGNVTSILKMIHKNWEIINCVTLSVNIMVVPTEFTDCYNCKTSNHKLGVKSIVGNSIRIFCPSCALQVVQKEFF